MPRKHAPPGDGAPFDLATFEGFEPPYYTPTPDALFDWVMADLTGSELKVLLYIVRRTFGFKKEADAISLEQITHGIVTHEGKRLDRGTGLGRSSTTEALRSLVLKHLVVAEERRFTKSGSLPTVYRLRIKGVHSSGTPAAALPAAPLTPERQGAAPSPAPQETVVPRDRSARNSHPLPPQGGRRLTRKERAERPDKYYDPAARYPMCREHGTLKSYCGCL